MKARNPSTGNLETVYVKALDSMPVGTIVDFDGQASDIPIGWETYGQNQLKKTSETRALAGNIVNAYSDSQTSAYSTEYINDCNTYSTTEINTGKKWTDGKTIYRKVVNGTLPAMDPGSTVAEANIAHGISNLGTVVSVSGTLTYSNVAYRLPLLSSNRALTIIRTVDSTNIVLRSSDGWQAGPPLQFIIEYTKSS